VLIVEDQNLIAQDLAALARETGAIVVGIAVDFADALLLAAEHRPDVAVMDVSLRTRDDAIRLAREICEMTDASIIFCTSDDDAAIHQRLGAFARVELLPKPIDLESFSQALLRICPT
jgi:DNA-binding NarL/FixJ family response regulator